MSNYNNSKILPQISSKRNSGGDSIHPLIIEEEFDTTNKYDNRVMSGMNETMENFMNTGGIIAFKPAENKIKTLDAEMCEREENQMR